MNYDRLGIIQITHEAMAKILGFDQLDIGIVDIKNMHDMNEVFEIVVQDLAAERVPRRELLPVVHRAEAIPIIDINWVDKANIDRINGRIIENADRFDIPDTSSEFEL